MADPRTARPVSGEIMAGAPAGPRAARQEQVRNDLVDADYETLPAAMRDTLPAGIDQARKTGMGDGMDMLRGASPATVVHKALTRGGPLFWIVGIAAVFAAFWVSGGHAIVSAAVGPSETVAAPMLVISDVASRVDVSGPKPLLFVDGQAGNSGGTVAVMTELEIRVTGNDGRVTRYNLGTSGRTMAPGEKFGFSSRLDVPKNGVKSVSVSFAE